jgi:hypothetical protein
MCTCILYRAIIQIRLSYLIIYYFAFWSLSRQSPIPDISQSVQTVSNPRYLPVSPDSLQSPPTFFLPIDTLRFSVMLMGRKGPEVQLHGFLTSKPDAHGQIHASAVLTSNPISSTHLVAPQSVRTSWKGRTLIACRQSNHGPSSSHYTD